MRAALAHDDLFDRRAATDARLSRTLINAMSVLKTPAVAIGIHVIRDRRSPAFDRLRQYLLHGVINPLHAVGPQRSRHGFGAYARTEQRLIGIDIADSAHDRLVQQDCLDRRFSLLQSPGKFRQRDFERLRPQRGDASRKFVAILDSAELPRIGVKQRTLIQSEDRMCPLRKLAVGQQLAGHPEMHHEIALIEPDRNELSMAFHRDDLLPRQRSRGFAGCPDQHSQPRKLGIDDAASDDGGPQSPDYGLDFGKLRHLCPPGDRRVRCSVPP